jgi:aminoglycoside phosphotransferase family enzyme/predicted kinase
VALCYAGGHGRCMVDAGAELRETHISLVVLFGDRVYKLKKPVRLDFVDLTTREARERICHREVELNRRIAPDVYLGVADVNGPDGDVCDHLVVMRRMPDDRRLSTLVRSGVAVDAHVREVARVVASFHSRAETSAEIAVAGQVDATRAKWEATFETVQPFVGTVLAPDVEERVRDLARRYLDGRAALFDHRIAQGKVVDGHGDLLADDIFCLDDGPRILDCVEFDDELRYGDVLADVCFLAMDLERIGAPDLGGRFLAWYRELSAETYPATLAHHYVAFRAHIRSMVACLRAAQGDETAAGEASRLLLIARDHLERGQVALVLVGGLPGTGKSTLAAGLADGFGWSVLRSDEVRKDLAGIAHTERGDAGFREGLYRPEATAATYREMLERARRLLELGEPVVLDASWTDARYREAATAVARETHSELVELECVAPDEVVVDRLASRAQVDADVSDATPEVAAAMRASADPWREAESVDTTASVNTTLTKAEAYVRRRLGIGSPPTAGSRLRRG